MKLSPFIGNRVIKNEEPVSKHINILTHYAPDTLLDKSGKLIQIIKLAGLDFITKDNETLNAYKIRRNNLLKNFSSEFALYFWEIKRKADRFPEGDFKDYFAKEVNNKYRDQIQNASMFHAELYIAVITKHPEGLLNKQYSLWNSLFHYFDKSAKENYLAKRHAELIDVTHRIMSSFADYDAQLLGAYEKNNVLFSAPLEMISSVINFDTFAVPLYIEDVSHILPRKRLFFSSKSGTIELRAAGNQKKFAAVLSIKAYSPYTHQGMLDHFMSLPCEYVMTQSFRFYDRQTTKARLRDQQKEMLQTSEESVSLTDQIDDAFDDAASGDVGFGKHHFTLVCYADSLPQLDQSVGLIVSKFSDIDIACVREDVACELGFWAQLPGNFGYIARPADISTKNMAALASLHNHPQGQFKGNHWGDAVTVFETLSGSPYYFNFHYKDVGNFLVFGAMGSGKTLLVGFLILQSMKFGGKRIFFDKDRGQEILVRAMGGIYERIKPNIRTGFNPCHLPNTNENRHFLMALFKKMLSANNTHSLTESDIEVIQHAINGMYRSDMASRQLCHIASYFGAKTKGSLRARFDQWHSDGPYAWLFDNEVDRLNVDADVLGFDLGHILTDNDCKTPALMYLTYRIEKAIEGERAILFCDEGWQTLDDDYFSALINDWSRTPRKKNNIFGLATQVANDTVNSKISKSINESAFCKIFFPNASADRKIHIEDFGLSEHKYQLVKTLPDDQHYFLLIYGKGINQQAIPLRLNLEKLRDVIPIISGRESTLLLLDQIRTEVGDDSNAWLPIFDARLKELK